MTFLNLSCVWFFCAGSKWSLTVNLGKSGVGVVADLMVAVAVCSKDETRSRVLLSGLVSRKEEISLRYRLTVSTFTVLAIDRYKCCNELIKIQCAGLSNLYLCVYVWQV